MASKSSLHEKYVKLDPREHVLLKPDMYIGSVMPDVAEMYTMNYDTNKFVKSSVLFIPGLFKIYDEIVANAIDHAIRLKNSDDPEPVKKIHVDINKETGEISIKNNGKGIEIAIHDVNKVYIPELLFGNLLTSSNYNQSEDRNGQGTNGIGCKACNIMSEWFKIETVDTYSNKSYSQTFENNMSIKKDPKIKTLKKKTEPYTQITFKPDYKRFGNSSGLSDDMYKVMEKRVYDICAVTDKDVNVYINKKKIECKSFSDYVKFYDAKILSYKNINNWDIAVASNDFSGFEQVSFVNGLLTINGGTHVKYVVDQLVKNISNHMKKIQVKPQNIKDHMNVFIKCNIPNPTFNSQSKESLTTPLNASAKKLDLPVIEQKSSFMTPIYTELKESINALFDKNMNKSAQKNDGKKKNKIYNMPKLDDATFAGGAKSKNCVLILTEGDSAASMALSGLSANARDIYGVFPLKGKIMNVKDSTAKKIVENDEITNLKKILGLESGKKYENCDDLRYGKILLMTDADTDGSHIKGLIFNLFHTLWPSLLKNCNFVTSMITPIIKAKNNKSELKFYNLVEYNIWKTQNANSLNKWHIKYYKGLGTSTNAEAKEYFKQMNVINYQFNSSQDDDSINLAFNKKMADDRKQWLSLYDKNNILAANDNHVSCSDFINKELIHFSNYDLERSIPSICDGLKISQRKILYSCFKRNLFKDEIRVAQLAGYVSEHSGYHHGEASLQSAIICLAQTFVGSNNINILLPNGQFGSRVHGGKDAGQPRYIHTLLSPIVPNIFIKSDANVLSFNDDDGILVEPTFYIPIIPMILVNGAIGIGTGFSTSIPCYNPIDIINIMKSKLNGDNKSKNKIHPYYKDFKGRIEYQNEAKRYVSHGIWKRISGTVVQITELPIGTWTFDYKTDLEALIEKIPEFKKYENKSAENIDIILHFSSSTYLDSIINGKFENIFKLVSSKGLNINNMYLFNEYGQIHKYNTVNDIIDDFYNIRLKFYDSRKRNIIYKFGQDRKTCSNKLRFILEVINKKINVFSLTKRALEDKLSSMMYDKKENSYEYLIKIPIYHFTTDKVKELQSELDIIDQNIKDVSLTSIESMWLTELDAFLAKI